MEEYPDGSMCESCLSSHYHELKSHCFYCGEHFGYDTGDKCSCGVGWQHCVDCIEMACKDCEICLVIDGENTDCLDGGCEEHELCSECIYDDPEHCSECGSCASPPCEGCGLCEDCITSHCPECGDCFGYGEEVEWCLSGGEHCVHCCEENCWLCDECGSCVEAEGMEFCEDCGLCEACCKAHSEDAGCTHGYCVDSADFDEHICPNCQQCPDDTECEYCGYCGECQEDYHCEHELCPEGPEWEEHLCSDCGECSDELCEYCGRCEDCADGYHCEHGYCPDDSSFDDDSDHFVCLQCGECFEGFDRCDYCELCTTCCEANTQDMGCDHDLCVESPDFADHWCYEDDQCLEKCNHDSTCEHANVSTEWNSDGNAHWHVCNDCGAAVDKAIHSEGEPVTVTPPDPVARKKGTANISCSVCNTFMSTVSIPYVPIPEDGSPYILVQPKDYEGKVSTVDWPNGPSEAVYRYASFKVQAGGKDLSYQWYQQLGNGTPVAISDDDDDFEGTQTATLKTLIYTDACAFPEYQKYYCVVSNSKGSVQTQIAYVKAQHVFGHYENKNNEEHTYCCNGECGHIKFTKPHRFGEWTVTPATETTTGSRKRTCMDCGYANTIVIPMVEPGHVHAFTISYYNVDEHWFACRCGVVSDAPKEAHIWGTPVVTIEPTIKRTGQQEVPCTVCSYRKTETLDKLPHTHDWYTLNDANMWIIQTGKSPEPNLEKWGRNPGHHFFHCKSCDQLNTEGHVWSNDMRVTYEPENTTPGKAYRICAVCAYHDNIYFPEGTYPVFVLGGKADKDYAAPGETVTITFDPQYFHEEKENYGMDYPVKLKKWYDGPAFWGDPLDIPWGNSSITAPRLTFASATSSPTTFTMPNGIATVAAECMECNHTVGTHYGERVEPTCTGYGHEPDLLCNGCGTVITPGERIEALGHDYGETPFYQTNGKTAYCTIKYQHYDSYYGIIVDDETTHPTDKGYTGDIWCYRCNKYVKGNTTPIVHKCNTMVYYHDKGYVSTPSDEQTRLEGTYEAPTCTKSGMAQDTLCYYCDKLLARGKKIKSTGHEWGEWEVIREATTKVKGREQRVCLHDETHVETRVTDYSGLDFTVKADKTKLNFEWVFGETPEPQTVTFRSVGRNEITGISSVPRSLYLNYGGEGMQLTVSPKVAKVLADPRPQTISIEKVKWGTWDISCTNVNIPDITVTFNIKKAQPVLSFAATSTAIYLGDAVEVPALTGAEEGWPLSWQSSNNAVAMVDAATGELNVRAAGTTVITVKYAGDDYHASAQASFTLHVRNPKMNGDVNKDGFLNIADVTALTNILLGRDNTEPYLYSHEAADVDGNRSLTVGDANTLANALLGKYGWMYVEDVWTLTGRGTAATGTVLRGLFRTGQPIVHRSIMDNIADENTVVGSIEMSRKPVPEAVPGDNVGLVIDIDKENVKRGDVLTTANNTTIIHSKTVKGTMYLLTKDEGGRQTPITTGYKPQMLVGGATFTVKCTDIGTVDGEPSTMLMPGKTAENIVFEVQDGDVPTTPYTYIGQEVLLREGGKTIGRLTITGE